MANAFFILKKLIPAHQVKMIRDVFRMQFMLCHDKISLKNIILRHVYFYSIANKIIK